MKSLVKKSVILRVVDFEIRDLESKITIILPRKLTSNCVSNCFQLFHLVFFAFFANRCDFVFFEAHIYLTVSFGLFIIFCE